MRKILIANRGEIAMRIMHSAAAVGMQTVAVYSSDDAQALHIRHADEAHGLDGFGVSAYMDQDQLLDVAARTGCDAVHPGYGFLSENSVFCQRVVEAGLIFVGPAAQTLALFGDKSAAVRFARDAGVPVLAGTQGPTTLEETTAFFDTLPDAAAMVIKAISGGGGRGIRIVSTRDDIPAAYEVCRSEAEHAFGNGDVYVERFMPRARHIEVQMIGDGTGAVTHLWERDCSIQRQNQKIIEIAPAPGLSISLRDKILTAATSMAAAANYLNIGTFEFLVADTADGGDQEFAFIEANPRLQVEHTVTEMITGLDIVALQLEIANGRSLTDIGLNQTDVPPPNGFAIQTRVNMEEMTADGQSRPATGTLSAYNPPSGPGIRVDGSGYRGLQSGSNFDSLLAKLIVHSPSSDFDRAVAQTYRALCAFQIEGVATNQALLQNILRHSEFKEGRFYTRFVADYAAELIAEAEHPQLFVQAGTDQATDTSTSRRSDIVAPVGSTPIVAPMQGTIIAIEAAIGDAASPTKGFMVMESMKMHHVIRPEASGMITGLSVAEGDTVFEGDVLGFIATSDVQDGETDAHVEIDLDAIRPDLAELKSRQALTLDAARPEAVARRRKTGQRTARENVDDLFDGDTFREYGALAIAAQRTRRSEEDLIKKTPADGLITGVGAINGDLFDAALAQCALMAYDYTVLAGTQGKKNHAKSDRILKVAGRNRLPVVLFSEGGGGRPGDVDVQSVAGLYTPTFSMFARLSGLVPLVGINSGRCFAGNASLLGCCDVIIATENSSIGMGGPAMIEGGGLGVFHPDEVGPMGVQVPNGVVDIAVADEVEAVAVAKKYLSYFQGGVQNWEAPDQRRLRHAIPENRLEIYDIRTVIDILADSDSVLEIRPHYGLGMVTAFIRVDGRPVGLIANNPVHLAGAIDRDGSDKANRFMQLCDAFDIPLLFLCDTPGIMVGPESEKTAMVRHSSRLFLTGANLTTKTLTIVLRKGYGLGAMAMAGGSFHDTNATISWPTGEFGGMGLEGAVQLGYRKELDAIDDPQERQEAYEGMVAKAYEKGKALSTATYFEVDQVIDPIETRQWIKTLLLSAPLTSRRETKKRPNIDAW